MEHMWRAAMLNRSSRVAVWFVLSGSLVVCAVAAGQPSAVATAYQGSRSGASDPTQMTFLPHRTMWDDFNNGFETDTPTAKWRTRSGGAYIMDDGIATTDGTGLHVVASGVNPFTGEPAFLRTVGHEPNSLSVPGYADHGKWFIYVNHTASTGFPGHDLTPGHEFRCEAIVSARTYGTAGHPFGGAVTNPEDDIRLATAGISAFDFDSFSAFDFFMSNQRIYAWYERLAARRPVLGDYASFSYMIPIAARQQ